MSDSRHLIGLLLGTENDWPVAFEELVRRLAVPGHAFDTERVTIEPFSLRQKARHDLVIDRLAYWYYHPREWLKKVALMDDVYLLNSPFTFQSMEKHSAYCALIRLGMKVPETDAQESGFSQFPAIVRFVASVHRGPRPTRPVPTVMTCGADEENLANNRRMVRVLLRLGYRVRFVVVPGGHDYTSWRAAFDPHLPDLLRAAIR